MSNGKDLWDERRKKIKEKLEEDAETDEDSDIPIHEEYTKEGKFPKADEEDED